MGFGFLLGKDITGIQWVYFWFTGQSHFNKPVLTRTYFACQVVRWGIKIKLQQNWVQQEGN